MTEATDYPVIDSTPFFVPIYVEELMPWLERYHSFGDDFAKQNELAFRLERRGFNCAMGMSLLMSDPRTSARTKQAVIHFASANYTDPRDRYKWQQSLTGNDDERGVIEGALKILRLARKLKPDGSDASWPVVGLLDPQEMPGRIAAVLKDHPEMALDVILTLEAYGPSALKETEVLMPLLLSSEPQIAIAAQAAILKMDSQGLAKLFQLNGNALTEVQIKKVRSYAARVSNSGWWVPSASDLRESDGSPLSEISRTRYELRRFMRFRNRDDIVSETFAGRRELAIQFRDQSQPGEWWKLLSITCSGGGETAIYGIQPRDQLLHFASALYTKPGAQKEMLRVLHSDDPGVAWHMAELLCHMRLHKPGISEYMDGDLVDPDVIPAELVKVGERHPHLKIGMAYLIGVYKTQAPLYVNTIVPLLLTKDTHDLRLIRGCITRIDPELAKRLDITYVPPDQPEPDWTTIDGPPPLTTRQRELIDAYLKVHPPLGGPG